jgi:hypothetical protein
MREINARGGEDGNPFHPSISGLRSPPSGVVMLRGENGPTLSGWFVDLKEISFGSRYIVNDIISRAACSVDDLRCGEKDLEKAQVALLTRSHVPRFTRVHDHEFLSMMMW